MATKHPGQKQHIDALVLVFSHSKARSLVGTDALRTVLSGQYRELVSDGVFSLDEVWALLENQPGFDPQLVAPPLCRFKLWETELGIEVALPRAMGSLSDLEIRARAGSCRVPEAELDRILERGRYGEQEVAARRARASATVPAPQPARAAEKSSRPWLVALLATAAVIAFSVAGYFVYQAMAPPSWDSIGTGFAADIPLASAEKSGFDVGATLRDDGWLERPEAERRAQLTAAIEALRGRGVKNLFVRDSRGRMRASAQVYGKPPRIEVKFY